MRNTVGVSMQHMKFCLIPMMENSSKAGHYKVLSIIKIIATKRGMNVNERLICKSVLVSKQRVVYLSNNHGLLECKICSSQGSNYDKRIGDHLRRW